MRYPRDETPGSHALISIISGIGLVNLYIFTSPSSSSNNDGDGDYIESKKLHLFIGSSSTTSTPLLQINNNQIEIDHDQKMRSPSPTTAKSSTSSTTEHSVSDQTTHEQTLISDEVSVNMTVLSPSSTTVKTPGQSEVEARIAERMRGIKEQCKKENYPTTGQYNMYYFNKFTVSWCPVSSKAQPPN